MDLLANFRIHLHFFVDVASSWNPFYKCKIQLHLNSETVASSIIITHMFVPCFTKYRLQLRACWFSSPVGFTLHSVQSWSYLLIVCLHSTENGYAQIPLQALKKQLCLNLKQTVHGSQELQLHWEVQLRLTVACLMQQLD